MDKNTPKPYDTPESRHSHQHLRNFQTSELGTSMRCWSRHGLRMSLPARDIDASCGIKGSRLAVLAVTKARPAVFSATEQGCCSMVAMLAARLAMSAALSHRAETAGPPL